MAAINKLPKFCGRQICYLLYRFNKQQVCAYSSRPAQEGSARRQPTKEDLIYTEEHLALRRSLNKIIEKDINPYVDQWEKERSFPAHTIFKKLGDGGFLGVCKPPAYGGMGLDYSYGVAVAEELGSINCVGVPTSIGVQTDMATPALARDMMYGRFGSDELKRTFLAPSISRDMVSCIGVSESGSGSDVASIKTIAVRKGDDFVINGSKMWITNGAQADWMCLLANTGQGAVHQNKSLICLPMNLPGVKVARTIDKLGLHCSDTTEIFMEDVRVPVSYLIGEENMGFMYQMMQFQEERLFATAACLLPLENIINQTAEYTKSRMVFGQPLINNQSVHFKLAELEAEIESLRSLLYRAVALYIQGQDVTKYASMCKLIAGRLCRRVTDDCLQYWGGMGFTSDVLVSRMYRDMRLISIGGGADEVMLSIICKYMDILPSPPKLK